MSLIIAILFITAYSEYNVDLVI